MNLSRKKPKTLSGIETKIRFKKGLDRQAGKNLKPYQGLKLIHSYLKTQKCPSRKKPKTLSGIETRASLATLKFLGSRKKPKTLSGIETNLT